MCIAHADAIGSRERPDWIAAAREPSPTAQQYPANFQNWKHFTMLVGAHAVQALSISKLRAAPRRRMNRRRKERAPQGMHVQYRSRPQARTMAKCNPVSAEGWPLPRSTRADSSISRNCEGSNAPLSIPVAVMARRSGSRSRPR